MGLSSLYIAYTWSKFLLTDLIISSKVLKKKVWELRIPPWSQLISLSFINHRKPFTAEDHSAMPQLHVSCLNSTPQVWQNDWHRSDFFDGMKQNSLHVFSRKIQKLTPFCSNKMHAQSLYECINAIAEYKKMLFIPCDVLSKLFISISIPLECHS